MRKLISSILIFVFAFLFLTVTSVSAKVITSESGSVTVAKAEVVNDDLFIGAQTVDIAGTVNGDVFIGAQTVKITGVVNGNLHVGANTVDLTGKVKGNVYTGAQSVLISGANIGGSLLVGAASVNLDKTTTLGGSLLAGAGTLSLDSQIQRSVYAGTGNLSIGADTKIGKDLYYAANQNQGQPSISPGAKIVGNTYKSEINTAQETAKVEAAKKQLPRALNTLKFGGEIISFIGALIIGFVYLKLFGKHFSGTVSLITGSFWKSFGTGFLVSIALIPGLLILLVTIIGIPVAGLVILLFALYSYLAKIVVGSAFGSWVSAKFKWKMSTYGAFAFGLLLIYIFKFIPVIGFVAGLVVFWAGLGALTLRMFSRAE